ncbi:MAG TPA: alginate export family protein [Phycisphaerae bacterium]|nr:alginate export family protein [Phycisphaerae bacterium]HOJ74464.1 alginate export family protein [Phycisphaerae bacterium]HOM53339.1 alginate export family protein [Phycisphaerae bacterium]HON68420.1 alginate export family protein [Phycisphaerae bacterium]HOQ86192.1 alginate export family protein [Phycisphaerae bacterium]
MTQRTALPHPSGLTFKALLWAAAWLQFAALAAGQPSSPFLQQQRAIEETVREEFNRDQPTDQRFDLDYGGWYSFYLFLWDDGVKSSRTFRQHDLRLWSSLGLDEGAHYFYARLKMQWQDFNHGDGFDDEDDFVGPDLDRGFYEFNLGRALRAYRGDEVENNLRLKVGRDFVDFGTGFALSLPLDQVRLTADLGKLEIQGLAATTIRSSNDIDLSRPNAGDSERNFWGAQVRYKGFKKHQPFAYFFYNEDQHREAWYSLLNNFDYDSWYVGLGSVGELVRNLRYHTEWVIEGGRSYIYRRSLLEENRRAAIQAWAVDFGLDYLTQWPMHPNFSGEYMFASGDPDRWGSPTNVIGGNRKGNDNSFSGFGYRYTGLAFAPRLSNIHIWRAGAAFLPLEKLRGFEQFELGTDWFLYAKNRSHGAVSDYTADEASGYLGWEMDYFANWRITSDLSWTIRFGSFFPGRAFSDQTCRTFFLTGVTYSF